MATTVSNLGTAALAAGKIVFLLVGIASTAVLIASIAIPYSVEHLSSSLPRLQNLFFSWLSPPYLLITVHFIIIVIWKLHTNHHPHQEEGDQQIQHQPKPSEISPPPVLQWNPSEENAIAPDAAIVENPPNPIDSGGTASEKDGHGKIEATWKAIMEGGAASSVVAPRPRMGKSNTWERCGAPREQSRFRKSETFRRVSVGREELFGRAEAFIQMHYEQRRIQRQESRQRYMEMVNAAC